MSVFGSLHKGTASAAFAVAGHGACSKRHRFGGFCFGGSESLLVRCRSHRTAVEQPLE